MVEVQLGVCSAGHDQTYARNDRPGRCSRCGSPLGYPPPVATLTVPTGAAFSRKGSERPEVVRGEFRGNEFVEDEEVVDGA